MKAKAPTELEKKFDADMARFIQKMAGNDQSRIFGLGSHIPASKAGEIVRALLLACELLSERTKPKGSA